MTLFDNFAIRRHHVIHATERGKDGTAHTTSINWKTRPSLGRSEVWEKTLIEKKAFQWILATFRIHNFSGASRKVSLTLKHLPLPNWTALGRPCLRHWRLFRRKAAANSKVFPFTDLIKLWRREAAPNEADLLVSSLQTTHKGSTVIDTYRWVSSEKEREKQCR